MSRELHCVDCGVGFTTQDALNDQIMQTDRGLHHRECVAAYVRGVRGEVILDEYDELMEEGRRRAMGDPPLPPERSAQMALPDYDRADRDVRLMERDQRWYGGRYDEDGMGC